MSELRVPAFTRTKGKPIAYEQVAGYVPKEHGVRILNPSDRDQAGGLGTCENWRLVE
jgi:hypothetical protein